MPIQALAASNALHASITQVLVAWRSC